MRRSVVYFLSCIVMLTTVILLSSCSNAKNTAQTRWWQSFNTRYNVYYNASQAYIEGAKAKETGNVDNFTEDTPLYTVGNKNSRSLGGGNFDVSITKCEKAIKLHSIKKRPEWTKNRRKTEKDKEWLGRREYNPFIWKAWYMMGRSQFMKGEFEEAASTFMYMTNLYHTQPSIKGLAQSWLAKCYIENEWYYDAEGVIKEIHRDTITPRVQRDLNGTMADYHLKQQQYAEAVPYLQKVIKHEKRRVQRAREWYLMGQIQTKLGHTQEAYKAYTHCIHNHPPYFLDFNARISRTEVMAKTNVKGTISQLRRMARNENNKDYLDQVYYALGNVYLSQNDTASAIREYEAGVEKATRSGVEKGVLMLKLGNIYWEQEKYSDAKRCYGQAIGMLDKERDDYDELSERSKILDELVPHTEAIHLQDSLQVLAHMDSASRDKVIENVIAELIKKEKEEQRKAEEEAAEQIVARQNAQGNVSANNQPKPTTPVTGNGEWYFYNPQVVQQGKTTFQRTWGKRENSDDWRRINKTVVASLEGSAEDIAADSVASMSTDSLAAEDVDADAALRDSLAADPHNKEYYYAQIPLDEERMQASNLIIMDALYNSGVIFKDKLDNLKLSEKALLRLDSQYPDYEKMADAYYHLFLLYARKGDMNTANTYVSKLLERFPDNDWTKLLSDPDFIENQMFGVHIEDSLYAATYDAFKANRMSEVRQNAALSEKRFPVGAHRAKFIFVDGMRKLNDDDSKGCIENMTEIVEKYPQSEVAEIAGYIINGVREGRSVKGGSFDANSIWERRKQVTAEADEAAVKKALSAERNVNYMFLLAYPEGEVNENQLLFDLAKYNFTNFLVRNFDITIEHEEGLGRMEVRGFRSYDEARQYSMQLANAPEMKGKIPESAKIVLISEENFILLGTNFSYKDYEEFYEKNFAPVKISRDDLLQEPENLNIPDSENIEEEDEENKNDTDMQNVDVIDDWENWF